MKAYTVNAQNTRSAAWRGMEAIASWRASDRKRACKAPLDRIRMGTLRWLLVIVLIHGIAPSIAEAAEAVVHLAKTGHIAHSLACEDDLGDQGREHSCGATYHRCDCCTASPSTAAARGELMSPARVPSASPGESVRSFARRALEPPFRPPIS